MKKYWVAMLPAILIVLSIFAMLGPVGSRGITAMVNSVNKTERTTIIIDPGHGGEDGGASTIDGVLESNINLDISIKLRDTLNLLGIRTLMIRTEDISVYTTGSTLAQKKASDLKERVRIANTSENSIYISIHQNHFSDNRYQGAQVFYGINSESKELAQTLQNQLKISLGSNRSTKQSKGIYIMENIKIPAILLECGFLSNAQEAHLLQDPDYQKILATIVASVCSSHLSK